MVQYLAARHTMVAQNKVAGHTRAQNQADTRHAHTGETLHYCLGLPTQTVTLTSNTSCLQFGPSVTRVTRLSPVTDFSGTFCHAPKY